MNSTNNQLSPQIRKSIFAIVQEAEKEAQDPKEAFSTIMQISEAILVSALEQLNDFENQQKAFNTFSGNILKAIYRSNIADEISKESPFSKEITYMAIRIGLESYSQDKESDFSTKINSINFEYEYLNESSVYMKIKDTKNNQQVYKINLKELTQLI